MNIQFSLKGYRSGEDPSKILFREFYTASQGEASGLERPRLTIVSGVVDESVIKSFPEDYAKFKALLESSRDELEANADIELEESEKR